MRIITGSARGRRLVTPEGLDTRPTAEAVKEAIFSAIQFEIEGKTVVDLFAGSGQLGLEALSRGAKKVFFVDNNQTCIQTMQKNIIATGFQDKTSVSTVPAAVFLKTAKIGFDIAFVDPPYEHKHLAKILPVLTEKMNNNGIIICEHEKELSLPDEVADFKIKKIYRHGKTSVTIYRQIIDESDDNVENNGN